MSTIRNTVESTLTEQGQGSYLSYAEPVVAALEAREEAIVTAVRQVATSKGLGDSEVDVVLEQVGLVEPTPEPEPVNALSDNGSEGEVLSLLRTIQAEVEALKTAARRHGVTV